jgi:hypothetical protein
VIAARRGFRDTLHYAHAIAAIRKHDQCRVALWVHHHNILPPTIVAPLPQVARPTFLFYAPTQTQDKALLTCE